MSRHNIRLMYAGRPVLVVAGYDRPLRELFLQIFRCQENVRPGKDEIIYEGKIQTLRRFQNEASEVREGQECGIVLDRFANFAEGDIIESYEIEKVAQEL